MYSILTKISSFLVCAMVGSLVFGCKSAKVEVVEAGWTIQQEMTVNAKLKTMTLEEKVCQMFILEPEVINGDCYNCSEDFLQKYVKDPVGGFIFFNRNLQNYSQVKKFISDLQKVSISISGVPLFMCVDEEGGRVCRIARNEEFFQSNSNIKNVGPMSEIKTRKDSYNAGLTVGCYLAEMGFNWDFAPVVDVVENESGPIGNRSFGNNPAKVSELAAGFAKGLTENKVMSCYKHFPGHGAVTGDTHNELNATEKTLEDLLNWDMIPYTNAKSNGIGAIMVSHISIPKISGDNTPASLCYQDLGAILLEKMEFEGLVITDALNMKAVSSYYTSGEAAVLAIQAGNDLLLMPQNYREARESVLTAVKSGQITEERINFSVRKILLWKINL